MRFLFSTRISRPEARPCEQLRQQGCQAEYRAVELTNAAQIKNVFAEILREAGRIDLLVNLAGGTLHKHPIQEFPLSEWREVIDVNLKATFLCCQAVCKPMRERKAGVIINTSSNFGITGGAGRTAYAASKAAVIAFTKSLAIGDGAAWRAGQCDCARTHGNRAGDEQTTTKQSGAGSVNQFPWDAPPSPAKSPKRSDSWRARRAVISPDRRSM